MSQQSIIDTRLWKWLQACAVFAFDIEPPFKEETLAGLPPGEVRFRASRNAVVDGEETTITLDVSESWLDGSDPKGDWRLDDEGCYLGALQWHAQVGAVRAQTRMRRIRASISTRMATSTTFGYREPGRTRRLAKCAQRSAPRRARRRPTGLGQSRR